MRGIQVVLIAAAAGCGKKETGSIYESANLEQATVTFNQELDSERRDLLGDITVTGAEKDWTVRVEAQPIEIYSPTGADLSAIDGLVDAQASIAVEPISEELSVKIIDADGNLHYLLEPVEPGPLTTEQFGLGLIAEATDLGVLPSGNYEVTLVSAWLRTDAGDVELLPGEPQQVNIEGAPFRAVLLSGFTTELKTQSAVLCDGADSRLAFELQRIPDGATPDLTPLVRDPASELPVGSCDPAPVLPE